MAAYAEGASAPAAMQAENFGCDLWVHIGRPVNGSIPIKLYNTMAGHTYKIRSRQDVSVGTWNLEKTLVGTAGQDFTETTVAMMNRPILFFIASQAGYEVGLDFVGIASQESEQPGPDSQGAAGPNHFVELVNGRIVVFDKTTGLRIPGEAMSLNQFFGGQSMFDSRLVYDSASQAWVACSLDSPTPQIILAVKSGTSPVPLSGWTNHVVSVSFPGAGLGPDSVTLGLDKNGIYMTTVQRSSLPSGELVNEAQTIVAVKKPEIYSGTPAVTRFEIDDQPADFKVWSIQPAVNFDDPVAGGYVWLVAKGPPENGPPYQGGAIYFRRLQWNGSMAEPVDLSWQLLEMAPTYRDYFDFDQGSVTAPQIGVDGNKGNLTAATGSRLTMAVVRNNILWTCHHVGLTGPAGTYTDNDTTGSQVNRSAIQWIKLQIGSAGQTLNYSMHGRIYDDCEGQTDPFWYFYPSLMVNPAGDMVVGFSGSSANAFAGAYFSWRLANGNTADRPILIQPGQAFYSPSGFADYSATCLDPVDENIFWTVQAYAKDVLETDDFWGTWIGRIDLRP